MIQRTIYAILLTSLVSACATQPKVIREPAPVPEAPQAIVTRTAPGVVEYVWEEPMVDVVEVPPGLDPEGHYYRPSHKAVIEIRQGRWKYHRKK